MRFFYRFSLSSSAADFPFYSTSPLRLFYYPIINLSSFFIPLSYHSLPPFFYISSHFPSFHPCFSDSTDRSKHTSNGLKNKKVYKVVHSDNKKTF